MNIIIHRGSHQIGGSCIELSSKNSRVLLDMGSELPGLDATEPPERALLPGVKALLEKNAVDGVLISHSHGDHIGLIDQLTPNIPVYIGAGALHIFNTTAQFTGRKQLANPAFFLESGRAFTIGDFTVTPYLLDHSGYDAYGFVITADGKTVVYTGDFRSHGKKANATKYFYNRLPQNIDALLIEGTMMSRSQETVVTEQAIMEKARSLMQAADAPVLVLQSSTNIDRLVGMYQAATASNRLFVIDIFTAHIVSQLATSIPKPGGAFKNIRVLYPYFLTQRMFDQGYGNLMNQFSRYKIKRAELGQLNNYCLLFRVSMLSDLEHIDHLDGASMIYSQWQGYKKERKVKKVLDFACQKKISLTDLHTSGHATVADLETVIKKSNPGMVLPIHTEDPEGFLRLSHQVVLPRDGEPIRI